MTDDEIKAELLRFHNDEPDDDPEADNRWECVDKGEWVSEYKDETRTQIYRHVPSGRFFAAYDSRRGSYWSDYEYEDTEAYEVRAVQVTVTQYEAIQ